ncbi:non-structural maintenance of chromosomes element 4 homolog A [Prosopis cineraria]|uniref:non-structural maintenance of chromosomes element 4 homolog A n=1 Tax=Prosopis cineraria TaxID=364024 RepID=UPI00240EBCC4|nr:non-structural maintenance of chromosomes element 4 homolog A [Prosopis cineraria]
MRAIPKREREAAGTSRTNGADRLRAVKTERLRNARVDDAGHESSQENEQDPASRRAIRSQYLTLVNLINEKRDDLVKTDSEKFNTIMEEVERLHEHVQKPREQVADAEALLDLATTLVGSVKSLLSDGATPSEFVSCMINEFGQSNRGLSSEESPQNSINWKDVGLAVSPIFMKVHGCCTMLGPMENELKQRKVAGQRKRARPTAMARPQQIDDAAREERTDTDKNMATMFEILRKKKHVRLESLMLNRKSFAQTVENLFALSFLVKDGRAEISMDKNGSHFVSPRNAPASNSVMSKQVSYSHFVFRYDFEDWKLMKDMVPDGEELMPHRTQFCTAIASQEETTACNSQPALVTTPIRKLTRNRGLVVQEKSVVEESPECNEENASRANAIRRCRLKLEE